MRIVVVVKVHGGHGARTMIFGMNNCHEAKPFHSNSVHAYILFDDDSSGNSDVPPNKGSKRGSKPSPRVPGRLHSEAM